MIAKGPVIHLHKCGCIEATGAELEPWFCAFHKALKDQEYEQVLRKMESIEKRRRREHRP